MTRHLSLADAIALHAYMMRAMDWEPAPLRGGGEGLLESAAVTFMELNGYSLRFDDLEMARQLEAVAERIDSLEAATERFEAWLRSQKQEEA